MPPASTSRTSRRLAKSRKGDATEEKNKNVLALAASTDVQVPSMTTAEEDVFSQIVREGSTERGTQKFHVREKCTLSITYCLYLSDKGVQEKTEGQVGPIPYLQ